jgi:hypothetical protein
MNPLFCHPLLLSRVSNGSLDEIHARVHEYASEAASGVWSTWNIESCQWGPGSLLAYHDLIVDEMRLRGLSHQSNLAGQVWFDRCLKKHRAEDVLADVMPFTRQDFVASIHVVYAYHLHQAGRLPCTPDDLIDLYDWTDAGQEARMAAFKLITAAWSEALKNV